MANVSKPNEVYLPDLPKHYQDRLDKIILDIIFDQYIKKLVDAVPFVTDKMVLSNSKDTLKDAIRSNQIIFDRGAFKGDFNAAITRELRLLGAEWDSTQGSWRVLLSQLPPDIQMAIRTSNSAYLSMTSKIAKQLDQITPDDIDFGESLKSFFATSIRNLDEEVTYKVAKQRKNLPTNSTGKLIRVFSSPEAKRRAINKISVSQQMTPTQIQKLAENYATNLELNIKNFTADQTIKLRERVMLNVNSGNRYENIIQDIKRTYGVTESKAKFLARQETNLMQAEIHQMKSVAAGSKGYIWVCVHGSANHPVRPGHKKLDQTYQTWDNPPIVDPKTGRRAHPGKDFNCRCRAKVVFGEYEKGK